jgi:hypothetical protein
MPEAVTSSAPPDRYAIQCNFAAGTRYCAAGARAYVRLTNPGGDNDRIQILARSRGGRWIERWEDIRHLRDFRVKTIPPEHPLYQRLDRPWDMEPTAARLNGARERHLARGTMR